MTVRAVAILPDGWIIDGERLMYFDSTSGTTGWRWGHQDQSGSWKHSGELPDLDVFTDDSLRHIKDGRGVRPPAVVEAAIGQPCQTCGGEDGLVALEEGRNGTLLEHLVVSIDRARTDRCPDCRADGVPTGLASIELREPCEPCGYGTMQDEPACGLPECWFSPCRSSGFVLVRVIPDRVVPIFDNVTRYPDDHFDNIPAFVHYTHAGFELVVDGVAQHKFDVPGDDPAPHVGRFVLQGRKVDQ